MQPENGLPEMKAAMARCRWHFISVAIFSVFVNLLMLTGPLFMLQIYDRVLSSRSEATLVALLVLVTGLFGMMGILEFIRGRVLARAGARFQSLLDSRVMVAVLRRSVQPAERAKPNTAARDLEAVRQLLAGPAPFALFDMPWAPIFIAVIFLFHPVLGWISVFGAMILVVLTLMNQLRSREPSAESQRATSEAENLGEALRQNAEAVQGLGMRGVGLGRWLKLRQEALSRQVVASDRTAGYTSSSKALRFYLQSVMLAAGAWLVLQQQLSAGMMIAASIMLGRALAPVEQAIGQWGLAQRAARGWAALIELLEKTPPEIDKTALPAPKGFVDVQGVTVVTPGDNHPVLRAINFKVQPGTALGVIGPSGAGKTTLAKVLVGIWRPAAGKVRIDGAAVDQWPEDTLGAHMGYLPQEIGLMSGSVAENIARMAEDRDDAEVVAAAQRAGAHDILLALPHGYDTQIGAGGQRLSGGQRQRVALARALYSDPPVLVLDEPNANLDAPGEQALVDAIREAKSRGKTVIIMAHRPSAIAACDLLLMIDKGLQIDFGPRDEVLKKRTKNYAQLPGGQAAASRAPATAQAPSQQVRMGAIDALLAEGALAKRTAPPSEAQSEQAPPPDPVTAETDIPAPASTDTTPEAAPATAAEVAPERAPMPASAAPAEEPPAMDAGTMADARPEPASMPDPAAETPAAAASGQGAPGEDVAAPAFADARIEEAGLASMDAVSASGDEEAEALGETATGEPGANQDDDLPLLHLPLSRLILTEPDPETETSADDEAPEHRPGFAERPTQYFSIFPSLGDHLASDLDGDPDADEPEAAPGAEAEAPITAEIDLAETPDAAQRPTHGSAEPEATADAATEMAPSFEQEAPEQKSAERTGPEPKSETEPENAQPTSAPSQPETPDALRTGPEATSEPDAPEGAEPADGPKRGGTNGSGTPKTPAKIPARGAAKAAKPKAKPRKRRTRATPRGQATGDES